MELSRSESLKTILSALDTERRDPTLAEIDLLTVAERCTLQNRLDQIVASAVGAQIEAIAQVVDLAVTSIRAGGRIVYVGAGTSGRLGVLDAAECPPTFGTDPSLVQAIIAGGESALVNAIEGVEDDPVAGRNAIDERLVGSRDLIIGITASGRTPYVLGALRRALELGARVAAVTNNRPSEIEQLASSTIAVVVGPEFIAGSTRLKAGTAQKLVLNTITTQAMIELGKTYGNIMVDVKATNAKLDARARLMVAEVTGADSSEVETALTSAGGSAKLAIVMLARHVDVDGATALLHGADGKLRTALNR